MRNRMRVFQVVPNSWTGKVFFNHLRYSGRFAINKGHLAPYSYGGYFTFIDCSLFKVKAV